MQKSFLQMYGSNARHYISSYFNETRKISCSSWFSAQKFVILAWKPPESPLREISVKSIRHTTLPFRPVTRSSSVHNADWHRRDFSRSSTCIEDTVGAHINFIAILGESQPAIFRKSNNFAECRERDFIYRGLFRIVLQYPNVFFPWL